jgi:hypothetical protein
VKSIETLKNISFDIYLRYGSEFIIRNKSSKYSFLKREELLEKIEELRLQGESSRRLASRSLIKGDSLYEHEGYENKILSEMNI